MDVILFNRDTYCLLRAINNLVTMRVESMKAKISILSPLYSKAQLENMLRLLNSSTSRMPLWTGRSRWTWTTVDTSEIRHELRRLVTAWLDSGPNLLKLFKQHPDLQTCCTRGTTILVPTREGIPQLSWKPHLGSFKASTHKMIARGHFAEFIMNPLSETLGGPCARCDMFYIKRLNRRKKYCSTRCKSSTTALSATQKRRQADYAEKLFRAERARDLYNEKAHREKNWKKWVCGETGITVKWITRAVNAGKLLPPFRH